MKIDFSSFFLFLIFCMICMPSGLSAQSGRQGNHCAVQKSPYRLSMDSGKVIYAGQCQSCHRADGLGVPDITPPMDKKMVSGDKKNLIEMVMNGHPKQEKDGKPSQNPMPPNPEIKDQEIADVLTYIRNSFGNKASMVKVSEVKSTRSQQK